MSFPSGASGTFLSVVAERASSELHHYFMFVGPCIRVVVRLQFTLPACQNKLQIMHSSDIRDTGIIQRVKNPVFLSIFDSKNENTIKVRDITLSDSTALVL